MNIDSTTGDMTAGPTQSDDQQMITVADRENYIARLTYHFGGNREMARHLDEQAISKSGGKAILYKKVLQMLLQQRNLQMQQQQQQQQTMMPSQPQQQAMYMSSQQNPMIRMSQQPQPSPSYAIQAPFSSPSTSMINIKQEPQAPTANVPMRPNSQNFPIQQQQQIKQELAVSQVPQQQIKQELMVSQQQLGMQLQQMRHQQPMSLPNQLTPQQRTIVQHLQQVRQQNHLNQQQQLESVSSVQMQQQQQSSNFSTSCQPSSTNTGSSSTLAPATSVSGCSDEILQQLLTSPNPPKQPSTAAQPRLRTINRNVRNQSLPASQIHQQQQSNPMTPGSDSMMMCGNIPSPHSHPGMMQQSQPSIGPPGQSPLTRYMMVQSPPSGIYRPQMSPMNMMNYPGSPVTMIDDEMHYLYKFFTDRLHYLTRIIARCQQEGQLDKAAKYRQLHDQMVTFVRNPIPEHLVIARRLKEHVDRVLDPRMFGPVMMSPMIDMTGMSPSSHHHGRLIANGIFEQCHRAIMDYLGKDPTLKYHVAKNFLEPLSEVLNGVPYKNIRLDTEATQLVEAHSSLSHNHPSKSLENIIENEFAHLSMNTFTYELKPLSDKMSKSLSSIDDVNDLSVCDYELTCRFIEINMPVVPLLKMKLTIQYPNEPPEVLSLTSTTMNLATTRSEKSDDFSFFELISRNFIYFLFKLPTQHTVTDILDIWRTAIQNAFLSQQES